jgi:hypothetical protein
VMARTRRVGDRSNNDARSGSSRLQARRRPPPDTVTPSRSDNDSQCEMMYYGTPAAEVAMHLGRRG